MDMTLERPCDIGTRITIRRPDGSEAPARLRLLGYDGCEFESDTDFSPGEMISIWIYRMGSIRARITSLRDGVAEAEFVKDCPV